MTKYIIYLFLLIFINKISCSIITFNSTLITQCTKETPCSLSNKDIWNNQTAPSNGDSVVIEFQTYQIFRNDVYFNFNNSRINLNSFSLYGVLDENYSIYLNIEFSHFTISNTMEIYQSVLLINGSIGKTGLFTLENTNTEIINSYITSETLNFHGSDYNQLIISNQSTLYTTGSSVFNVPTIHYDGNLLFYGQVYIYSEFNSNGMVDFESFVEINANTTFNILKYTNKIQVSNQFITINGSLIFNANFQYNSGFYLNDSSVLTFTGTLKNNSNLLTNEFRLGGNSILNIPSGFTFNKTNSNVLFNGTINIIDSNQTSTIEINTPGILNINCLSNLILNNTQLNNVTLLNPNTWLNVTSSSNITSLYNNGLTNINNNSKLILFNSSFSSLMNNNGILEIISGTYNGSEINLYSNSILNSLNSEIISPIIGNNNITILNGIENNNISNNNFSIYKSLSISQSSNINIFNSLVIENNLTVNNSNINFYNVNNNINNTLISLNNGSLILDQTNITINFNQPLLNNDLILIQFPNSTLNYINISSIELYDNIGSLININYTLNTNLNSIQINFKKSQNNSNPNPKYYIIGIVLGCIGGVVLLSIIIYCIKKQKRNHGEHQSLINH